MTQTMDYYRITVFLDHGMLPIMACSMLLAFLSRGFHPWTSPVRISRWCWRRERLSHLGLKVQDVVCVAGSSNDQWVSNQASIGHSDRKC